MIDSVSVNNENMVINTGEGYVPSQPPSPSTSPTPKSSSGPAAEVEISGEVKNTSQAGAEAQAVQASKTDKSSQDKSEREFEAKLKDTIDSLNEKLTRMDREVLFKLDKKIDKSYISVIDKKSKEIIREFPPEEIRAFIARFDEINDKLSMSQDVKSLIINLEV